jgi:hypothetical protein
VTATELNIGPAFLSALMLMCSFEGAECAVSNAIAISGPDVTTDELVVATAKCATDASGDPDHIDGPASLPPELRRLFLLSPVRRKCFVLRMLLRFTAEATAAMMGLRPNQFEEEMWHALQDLAFGADIPSCGCGQGRADGSTFKG